MTRAGGRIRLRLFVTAWAVFSAHFATNIVREHYPAFALVARGDYRLDDYVGFHSDIFLHTDGHAYINNNVGASVIASLPLIIFEPLLRVLDARARAQLAASGGAVDTRYDTSHKNRAELFKRVRERGWDLRFGASAAITSAFLMAPLSALMVVLMFDLLRRRGIQVRRAVVMALAFAFATPVFFRTASLNHNMMVMYAAFGAWCLLESAPADHVALRTAALAGLIAGVGPMCDYSGVIPLTFLGLDVLRRCRGLGARFAVPRLASFGIGALGPIAVQLHAQWICFGDWIHPPATWMAAANFIDRGYRGFALPAPDLFLQNLFEPRWGLFAFGPLLLFAFIGIGRGAASSIVSRSERRFGFAFVIAFLLFCAANQFARMQWNTGIRYVMPLVPFLFLAACDGLARLPSKLAAGIIGACALHEWVLCLARTCDVRTDWTSVFEHGALLPWLSVLAATATGRDVVARPGVLSIGILLALGGMLSFWWWRAGPLSPTHEEAGATGSTRPRA